MTIPTCNFCLWPSLSGFPGIEAMEPPLQRLGALYHRMPVRQELGPLVARERLRQRLYSGLRARTSRGTSLALVLTASLLEGDEEIPCIRTCKVFRPKVGGSVLFPSC